MLLYVQLQIRRSTLKQVVRSVLRLLLRSEGATSTVNCVQ